MKWGKKKTMRLEACRIVPTNAISREGLKKLGLQLRMCDEQPLNYSLPQTPR
jgi:hypothetical protein